METVAFSISGEHLAVVRQFAKDQGYPSTSSALRRIIDEWRILKARQLDLALDSCCEEEARATVGAVALPGLQG